MEIMAHIPKKVKKALLKALRKSYTTVRLLDTMEEVDFIVKYRVSWDKRTGEIYRMNQIK